jgi:acyl carrier protein
MNSIKEFEMTKNQIRDEVTSIVARVLNHTNFELTDCITAGEIDGWDSLSHMVIISEVEKHFKIRFSFADVLNFNTMSDLFNSIIEKVEG